jgi:hypothetical protein
MKIKDFLVRLEGDENLLERYVNDPQGTAQAEGLSPGQARTLASGKLKDVKRAINDESPGETLLYVIMVM